MTAHTEDWWTRLYGAPDPIPDASGSSEAPEAPSTVPPRPTAPPRPTVPPTVGGGRLPPPGQVVDLDQLTPAQEPEPDVSADTPDEDNTAPDTPPTSTDTDDIVSDIMARATIDHRSPHPDPTTPPLAADDPPTAEDDTQTAEAIHRVADVMDKVADRLDPPETAAEERAQLWAHIAQVASRWSVYNGTAAATGYLVPAGLGYPDASLPSLGHRALSHYANPAEYHWSTVLVFAGLVNLAVWAVIDARTRSWRPWAAWICRIPLASTAAGSVLATWPIAVHITTGAPV